MRSSNSNRTRRASATRAAIATTDRARACRGLRGPKSNVARRLGRRRQQERATRRDGSARSTPQLRQQVEGRQVSSQNDTVWRAPSSACLASRKYRRHPERSEIDALARRASSSSLVERSHARRRVRCRADPPFIARDHPTCLAAAGAVDQPRHGQRHANEQRRGEHCFRSRIAQHLCQLISEASEATRPWHPCRDSVPIMNSR